MKIQRTVTLSEIPGILDKSLEGYKSTGKKSNLLFLGEEGFGRARTIKNWISKKHFKLGQEVYPFSLDSLPGGRGRYSFADDQLEFLTECDVLLNRRLNLRREDGMSELAKLINNRSYTGFYGAEYDFSKLFLVVATAFPDNGRNHVFGLDNPIFDLFEIYQVSPTVDEVSRYLIGEMKKYIALESGDLQDYEENKGTDLETNHDNIKKFETRIGILEKLVGLNVPFDTIAPCKFDTMLSFSSSPEDFIQELSGDYYNSVNYLGMEKSEEAETFLETIKKALLESND